MSSQKIILKLTSKDIKKILKVINVITTIADNSGARYKIKKPYKEYKAVIEIKDPCNETIEGLMKYKNPKSVNIEVN